MLRHTSVLVVDDEEVMREVLQTLLSKEGCTVSTAVNGDDGLELARGRRFDVAIVDVMMPGIGGIETLDRLRRLDEDLPVILITAYASLENAIKAMKRGAFDYITKPFKNEEVLVVVRNAAEKRRLVTEKRRLVTENQTLVTENQTLRANLHTQNDGLRNIIGRSPRMRQVFELITQAAMSRATILVEGESGTGKELAARALHAGSPRADHPFVTVNSGSLPPDLLESNLFGHLKGAFTGAVAAKKGLFELADKGTIFFDEIGSVPVETQAKLLRVIQEREFMRLGGVETKKVDTRIIAATNIDLQRLVAEGKFREDLYYRLHVIKVELPPLRDRREDIPLLARHFLEKYGAENDKENLVLTVEALDLMVAYDWPGNVRELENVIERAVVLATGPRIGPELIPDAVRTPRPFRMPRFAMPPEGLPFKEVVAAFETQLIERTLAATGGVQKRAAEMLQIKPTTLNEMIKRYDILPRRKRGGAQRRGGADADGAAAGNASGRERRKPATGAGGA